MATDITATTINSTGTVFGGPARLRTISYVNTATAGSVVFRDGGASGPIKLIVDTAASVDQEIMNIPDQGIRFQTDIHATLTNVTSLTSMFS